MFKKHFLQGIDAAVEATWYIKRWLQHRCNSAPKGWDATVSKRRRAATPVAAKGRLHAALHAAPSQPSSWRQDPLDPPGLARVSLDLNCFLLNCSLFLALLWMAFWSLTITVFLSVRPIYWLLFGTLFSWLFLTTTLRVFLSSIYYCVLERLIVEFTLSFTSHILEIKA